MARPRKEQKRQRRRAEKRKALRKRGASRAPSSVEQAELGPVHECLRHPELFDSGMGTVLVSRRMSDGRIAFGFFLVDLYCLGVKGAVAKLADPMEYRNKRREAYGDSAVPISGAYARKLIEGAVEYARGLGLEPHRDYRTTRAVLEGIDPGECATEFQYGCQGKPHFIAGPNDDARFIDRVCATLESRVGRDGYECTIPLAGGDETERLG